MFRNFLTYTNANCFWQFIYTYVTHLVEKQQSSSTASRQDVILSAVLPVLPLEDRQEQRCSSPGGTRAETSLADTSWPSCRWIGRRWRRWKYMFAHGQLWVDPHAQITNDGHWLDDTVVHRDGSDHCKCVAELNQRSSVLSPFNCSIQHTDQQTVHRTVRYIIQSNQAILF